MSTKRKIEDYKDQKVAIHCSTQEEWDKIVDLFPSDRSVEKIYWQQEINGKSDTININGYGWSPKKHFENTGYTIYPASDFLEEKPFKFNIGDEIKAKLGGYYFCYPERFEEQHKISFPSSESRISGKITERTQAQGFNWYRCGHGNWITEEGVELVKEDIPEYIEYIDTKYKGQIVKVEEWTNHSFCCIRFENGQREQPFKNLVKPSTKEAYDLQEIKPKVEMLPYPTDKKYFKAVVVKDIHKKDIKTKGDMPDLIPKGYQTWFRGVGTYHRGNIFQSSENPVCPEDNRWRANIPTEYFQIVEDEKHNDIPKECYPSNEIIIPQVIKSSKKQFKKITIESPTELDLKLKTIKPKQIQTIKI